MLVIDVCVGHWCWLLIVVIGVCVSHWCWGWSLMLVLVIGFGVCYGLGLGFNILNINHPFFDTGYC